MEVWDANGTGRVEFTAKELGESHLGVMVEYGDTSAIFTSPREERTKDYITGRYG